MDARTEEQRAARTTTARLADDDWVWEVCLIVIVTPVVVITFLSIGTSFTALEVHEIDDCDTSSRRGPPPVAGRPSGRPRHRAVSASRSRDSRPAKGVACCSSSATRSCCSSRTTSCARCASRCCSSTRRPRSRRTRRPSRALALLLLVPLYGAAFRRTDRNQLVRWVTGFFIATLGRALPCGTQRRRHRLRLLRLGRHLRRDDRRAVLGARGRLLRRGNGPAVVSGHHDGRDARRHRRPFGVSRAARRARCVAADARCHGVAGARRCRSCIGREAASRRRAAAAPASAASRAPTSPFGGFSLIARDRYLLLVALLIVLLNCVSTMGDYLLTDVVIRHAEEQVASDPSLDKGQLIGEFYASFYLAVNVLTVVMQVFLVGRLFRWIGVNGALLVLPVIALIGYGLVAFLPIFGLLRVVKVCEYSGNYSVLNTARQALFLPLSTKGKYEGKIATDTFFWRFGDLIPAAIVFVGLHWLDFGTQQFAVVNMGLSLAWLAVARAARAAYAGASVGSRAALSLVRGRGGARCRARVPDARAREPRRRLGSPPRRPGRVGELGAGRCSSRWRRTRELARLVRRRAAARNGARVRFASAVPRSAASDVRRSAGDAAVSRRAGSRAARDRRAAHPRSLPRRHGRSATCRRCSCSSRATRRARCSRARACCR